AGDHRVLQPQRRLDAVGEEVRGLARRRAGDAGEAEVAPRAGVAQLAAEEEARADDGAQVPRGPGAGDVGHVAADEVRDAAAESEGDADVARRAARAEGDVAG